MRSKPEKIIVMNSTLTIPNVTVEDNGIYICRATINSEPKKDASVKVIVHGEYVRD